MTSSLYAIGSLLINSKNSQELENTLNDLIKTNSKYTGVTVFNYDNYVDQQRRMVLVVKKSSLYGFISVITLIGSNKTYSTL